MSKALSQIPADQINSILKKFFITPTYTDSKKMSNIGVFTKPLLTHTNKTASSLLKTFEDILSAEEKLVSLQKGEQSKKELRDKESALEKKQSLTGNSVRKVDENISPDGRNRRGSLFDLFDSWGRRRERGAATRRGGRPRLSRFAKGAGILGVLGVGLDVFGRASDGQSTGQIAVGVGSGLAGAWAGAQAGGAVGAAFGGVGAVPGAAIGGILGYMGAGALGDSLYNSAKPDPTKEAAAKRAARSSEKMNDEVIKKLKKDATRHMLGPVFGTSATFAEYIGKVVTSIGKYLLSLPERLLNFASNAWEGIKEAGSNLIEGFTEGYQNVEPAGSSENAAKAMSFFQSQGWSKEQAAGIVGNLQAESGKNLDPRAFNRAGGGQGARGIAQWRGDRLKLFREKYNKDVLEASFDEQLKFVQYELSTTHKGAGKALRTAKDAKTAAMIVEGKYEIAGGSALNKRIANAVSLSGGSQALARRVGRTGGTGVAIAQEAGAAFVDNVKNIPGNILKYIKLASGVNLKGLHPTVLRRFSAMAMEYNQMTGRKIQVNSAFRSRQQQERLYRTMPRGKAARPGTSRHESGLAIDINTVDANALVKSGLMSKYGFTRPLMRIGETWHIEPVEGRNLPRHAPGEETDGRGNKVAVNNNGRPVVVDKNGNQQPKSTKNPLSQSQRSALWKKAQPARVIALQRQQPQSPQILIGSKSLSKISARSTNPKIQYRNHLSR